MWKSRAIAFLIVLFAFAMRMNGLDSARYDYDRSYPHGLGIAILDDLASGQFSGLPLLSLTTTAGLPNTAGLSYLWALVGVFDRSAFTATAISVMLDVLAVAMTFDLGRRLFGRSPAIVAASLAAGSIWGVFLSRGTWVQGVLEFCSIAAAWLVISAILRKSRRRLLIGLLITAALMQTYALAYGLMAQVAVLCGFGIKHAPRLKKPALIGLIVCTATIVVYLLVAQSSNSTITSSLNTGLKNANTVLPSTPNPFGLHLDFSGFDHALRFASGRNFEDIFLDRTSVDFDTYALLGKIKAQFVDALILVGICMALVRSRRDVRARMTLAWFAIPVIASIVLAALLVQVQIPVYYLPLASPGGYLLAGLPFVMLDRRSFSFDRQIRRSARFSWPSLAVVTCCIAANGISILQFDSSIESSYANPYDGNIIDLPLRWQNTIGRIWRENCSEVDNWQHYYWLTSILQSTTPLRHGAATVRKNAEVWQISSAGGNCVTTVGELHLPVAAKTYLTPAGGVTLITHRARPIEPASNADPAAKQIQVNLGWTLLNLDTSTSVAPGEWITVTHTWHIDSLPDETYWYWYFAPFVDFVTPDGELVQKIDDAPAVQGSNWRVGDQIVSMIRFQAPADLTLGTYKLMISLFDPNQKKNAVYFDMSAPDKPIITFEREIQVTGPGS